MIENYWDKSPTQIDYQFTLFALELTQTFIRKARLKDYAKLEQITKTMSETDLNDLNESIKLLYNYHDRLHKEVINVARKLQMPPTKIDSILENHSELNGIKQTLLKLKEHRDKQSNQIKSWFIKNGI